jgi:hypothetical protein
LEPSVNGSADLPRHKSVRGAGCHGQLACPCSSGATGSSPARVRQVPRAACLPMFVRCHGQLACPCSSGATGSLPARVRRRPGTGGQAASGTRAARLPVFVGCHGQLACPCSSGATDELPMGAGECPGRDDRDLIQSVPGVRLVRAARRPPRLRTRGHRLARARGPRDQLAVKNLESVPPGPTRRRTRRRHFGQRPSYVVADRSR